MSEYWKSNPRKFCKLCSCWFGENKVSIENHERGKQHQENLKKQISQLGQNERIKKQQDASLNQQLRRIEAAAQTAYANDVYTGKISEDKTKIRPLAVGPAVPLPSKPKTAPKASPLTSNPASSWFQGKGPDGRLFYFNKVTHENLWEPPPCGFVPLPQAKRVDLQLPKVSVSEDMKRVEQLMEKTIDEEFAQPSVEEKIIFEEKTLKPASGTIKVKAGGSLFQNSSSEPVAFKKRRLDKPPESELKRVCP